MSAEERRESVVRAAVTEFARTGYHGTSTEAIARRVGVSQPYLFRLFPGKQALFRAAAERCFDRTVAAFARCAPVRACVNAMWPALDPAAVVFALLTDPVHLAAAADGLLSDVEQQLLAWPAAPRSPRSPRSPRAARWSASDAVLIDEVADLLERTPSYGHVVLDEAQDLSPMQCRAVGRRCSTTSPNWCSRAAVGACTTLPAMGSWITGRGDSSIVSSRGLTARSATGSTCTEATSASAGTGSTSRSASHSTTGVMRNPDRVT